MGGSSLELGMVAQGRSAREWRSRGSERSLEAAVPAGYAVGAGPAVRSGVPHVCSLCVVVVDVLLSGAILLVRMQCEL